MPFTFNDSALLAALDALPAHMAAQAEKGLEKQSAIAEAEMQATNAHGDVTGATRASYRAFVIGGTHTGSAEAASGYSAAQAANPAGALSQSSGVSLGPEGRGVILTSFTDYQDKLETENAGQKAVLGPTLQQNAQAFTQAVAAEGL